MLVEEIAPPKLPGSGMEVGILVHRRLDRSCISAGAVSGSVTSNTWTGRRGFGRDKGHRTLARLASFKLYCRLPTVCKFDSGMFQVLLTV